MTRSTSLIPCLMYLLVGCSTGHFLLNYPPTIGFDDDLQGTPPCGSFKVDFSTDNVTDFSVGGDALAMTSIHPQVTWLFRATLDQTASGNWTDLLPAVEQTGLGQFCEPDVTVPSSFAGSKGVIQVVQDAPDGILYQCAAVNFVAGSTAAPSICTNVTGLSANYTTDPVLSSLPASAAPTSTAASSSRAASSTSTPSSASRRGRYEGLSSIVWLGLIASGTLIARLV